MGVAYEWVRGNEIRQNLRRTPAENLQLTVALLGEQEAEDSVQEVFAKVSSSLDSFEGQSKLSTWVYRIATNTAIDKFGLASRDMHPARPPWKATPEMRTTLHPSFKHIPPSTRKSSVKK
ncbi:MAG: hypothetical protein JSW26_17875 [Desulfobacterales bacterium]|nr:MAG: hypothetical protein JSW26_17875 [Desulfobacterales bacterium]